jgi:hypothetical protein
VKLAVLPTVTDTFPGSAETLGAVGAGGVVGARSIGAEPADVGVLDGLDPPPQAVNKPAMSRFAARMSHLPVLFFSPIDTPC